MNRSQLVSDRLYHVEDVDQYFWSPDGVGGYWYDSLAEAFAQHGRQRIYSIITLTDW